MNFLPSGATYKNRKMLEDSYNATYDDCTGFYLKNKSPWRFDAVEGR